MAGKGLTKDVIEKNMNFFENSIIIFGLGFSP